MRDDPDPEGEVEGEEATREWRLESTVDSATAWDDDEDDDPTQVDGEPATRVAPAEPGPRRALATPRAERASLFADPSRSRPRRTPAAGREPARRAELSPPGSLASRAVALALIALLAVALVVLLALLV